MTWEPIETAPKDGTWMLASAGHEYVPCVVAWRNDGWVEPHNEEPCQPDLWPLAHWMPLPEPPEQRP